jgi:hypothetical protein
MNNDILVAWSTAVSALAALGILYLTWLNYRFYRLAINSQDRNEKLFADLLQAIVISNMTQLSGGGVSVSIENFKKYYKGETKIF